MYFTPFNPLPNEIFFPTVIGSVETKSLTLAIQAVNRLRLVCSEIKTKVDNCWQYFIGQSEFIKFLPPFSKQIALESPLNFLKENYIPLKKWVYLDLKKSNFFDLEKWSCAKKVDIDKWLHSNPRIDELKMEAYNEICVVNNPKRNPELWKILKSRRTLICLDLKTRKETRLELNEELIPTNPRYYRQCIPLIATTDKWMAIIRTLVHENVKTLYIFDKITGICRYKITNEHITHLFQFENNFLYVLFRNGTGSYKLLRYDTLDWEAEPKERVLPIKKPIFNFYLNPDGIFFSSTNQVLVIPKEESFSMPEPCFLEVNLPSKNPILRPFEDGFISLVHNPNPKDSRQVMVQKLSLSHSKLEIESLQTLPMKMSDFRDFNVQLNRIFTCSSIPRNCSISCYDLDTGNLLLNYTSEVSHAIGGALSPRLVVSSPEQIQLLYPACEKKNLMYPPTFTFLLTLDYRA